MKVKEKVITIKLVLRLKEDLNDIELARYIEESAANVSFGKCMWKIGTYEDFEVRKIKTRKAF